tara:strand:- start:714 stop:887 length:174 start_codon:yes stop_codon:yes gene_type:complete
MVARLIVHALKKAFKRTPKLKNNKKEPTRFEFNDKKNPDEDALNEFIKRSMSLKIKR